MTLYEHLNKYGYKIFDNLISENEVSEAKKELDSAFYNNETIKVDGDGIRIKTLNGVDLLNISPYTQILYNKVLFMLQKEFECIYELDDQKIGISANLLVDSSDQFRLHFDRNQVTIVIYLTESPQFPLELYPLMREDPRAEGKTSPQLVKSTTDVQSVTISPTPGKAVCFWGRRTIHGISYKPEKINIKCEARYSLQFAFDLEKTSYNGEQYYGS